MAEKMITERVADIGQFAQVKAAGHTLPFVPQNLAHIYIKLDIQDEFENARSNEDARKFFRSVSRASLAADSVASRYRGVLLEVQGSLLHVGLPQMDSVTESVDADNVRAFVAELHAVYRIVFSGAASRVQGWRMTVDAGRTLVVAGRGIHDDDSWVSLGQAANRPAKHLYSQLEKPESDRALKRFWVGYRHVATSKWTHENLDQIPARLDEAVGSIAENVRRADPQVEFLRASTGWKRAYARALPMGPAGTPTSPSPETPHTSFGWVMRADLDGFTARVQDCLDKDEELQELAREFYCIMDAAAEFAKRHKETLAQLPWAGDNFTAAAVFAQKRDYDDAVPTRLIELSMDYEKDMADAAIECGFGGWAHGVAGGDVHGNAAGNVFLAGIEAGGRRFLVGAGEGFGRSAQAYGDTNPKAGVIALYKPDRERLDESYKRVFKPARKPDGSESTLYYSALVESLVPVRARMASETSVTTISFPGEAPRAIPNKPYFK
jgi:hypothetical protein